MTLMMDQLKPRNLTSTYSSIHFLENINNAWKTNEIRESVELKMNMLKELIAQLNEIEEKRHGRRLEIFLNLLGVFALSSLIFEFIDILANNVPAWIKILLGLGIPSLFAFFVIYLIRKK